ncbi:hypothetical protein F7018_16170 [Tenacibaculum aiptasiae]|uniref:histidine kinase n=1 Tax=Tenacibaculum aiptasiae TaxID=426481 RepID=A0A7J5A7R0_9FLAO|nr:sensor histidine kinase [Tenacibaculum aiptasiae]KAB1153604.1 hypothetical protein F7018_16170 [Tenacibaculum aiptasiae]
MLSISIKKSRLQIIFLMICGFSYSQNKYLDSANYYFEKAQYSYKINKNYEAYKFYLKSKKIYQELKLYDDVAKCNIQLFSLTNSQNNLQVDSKPYLDSYYNYALKIKDSQAILTSFFRYAQYYFNSDSVQKSSSYYKKVLRLTINKKTKANTYANLALLYSKKFPDSAQIFFDKTLNLYSKEDKDQLFSTYINYANFLQQKKLYNKAIHQLKKAEKIEPKNYKLEYKKILFGKLANCYKEINNFENAYKNYAIYNSYRDSLNNTQQNIAISDLDKKYKTAEKEKENIELKAKRKQDKLILLIGAIFVLFGGIITYLNLKNSKKKRLLAEQQKELEKQKNLTLLKEQEINTINAMIDGQEKERVRIAEDLHDNIGSVLATLKLHFENLKLNREKEHFNQDELYAKTEKLIDETYLKVRNIAHAKNAGVIANKGLLVAVKMMAEKISDANKITIEVLDFGLDKPMENSLEIVVFRIVQELTTNIIKHANATHATINISQFDSNLNIIIEDNGQGFNMSTIELKNGMGLNSIQTRIKHLKGTFEIDSTINKGTSIIIDIPIINT